MSDELNPDGLEALSAAIGFNDGANKGFWRFQPREKVGEDAGQWIEMGAELRMFYKNKRGQTDSVVGRAVGSTGSPDGVRVLVQGQGAKGVADGIYGADTANVRIAAAILPDEVLEEQGIKNTIKISPEQEALLPTLDSLERADITDGDLRLINEGSDSAEAKEQAVYKKSVQAKEKKTISPEAIEQMRKGLEKMKQLNLGLSDKIKALFPNFKKSKMNNPSLNFYSRSKRETYGQGPNPIVVPGGDYGRFSYFDEDGQLQSISVDKLADGRMRVNTYDRNIGEGLALEVRLNKDSGKWGVYSKSDGDGTFIGGELLNEFDSSEDARSSAISGINEALGFDPDNRFSLGPGITALRKRNENPRTKFQRDWVDVKPSPEFTSLMDARDQAAADVMADVQYNGDVDPDVDIDVLIDRAKKPVSLPDPDEEDEALPGTPTLPTQKAPAGTTLKWGDEWKRGDTLFSPSGKEIGTVLGNSTAITNAKGEPGYAVNIQNVDGNVETIRIAKDDGLYVSKTKKKDLPADPGSAATPKAPAAPATPSKPAAPAAPPADVTPPAPAAPAAPAKPAAPTKPAAPQPGLPDSEKPKKKKAEDKALRSGREDDGKPIAPTTMTNDELREIVPANVRDEVTGKLIKDDNGRPSQDPDAIIDALLETHPNAKVTKEGEIILERARFTDNDGQQYDYEIGISRTFNNSFSERWSFTNVATGEKQEFFSVDQKDSFSGIFGKKNGPQVFRDHLLGRTSPLDPKKASNKNAYNAYFADDRTLADRIKFFRAKNSTNLNDPNRRILTEEELFDKYFEGRPDRYNETVGKQRGTKLQSAIPSFFDIIDNADASGKVDTLAVREAAVQLLGRLRDTQESREKLSKYLRRKISQRYNGTGRGRQLSTLANNIDRAIKSAKLDIRDVDRIPYSSKNGTTPVAQGYLVEYENNNKEFSVGYVSKLNQPRTDSQGYTDTVEVTFANGTVAKILATKSLKILDDSGNPDLSKLTSYKPWLKNKPLREARGYADYGDQKRIDADTSGDDPTPLADIANPDAGAPYLGEQGVEAEQEPQAKDGNVVDLGPNDPWYDEDGNLAGTIIEVAEVEAEDGGPNLIGVVYLDAETGEEVMEIVERTENRDPK